MKKRYIIPIIGAIASVGVGYMMKNKNQDNQSDAGTLAHSLANAGIPDQMNHENYDHAQFENAKMVSEGSQFGVQYFNEVSEDDVEKVEEMITE
ncbi:hypothetical protein ACFSKI_17445 [Pseudogracilibacillus auburnensis]|uniref:Uncharacterized protein n=1 Tax=Pseudogracilibacillus auburnensis TaxID=1494959 RepID=A0A2V3W4H8_9BACI|nr:hypothetical protein [Pseudogracilibacillus auburnensis]MBO1003554.1 hypothetical protein [Pseudogracilibacillus auburnensis]PXW89243.1 hypothetical protein DFR56_10219 [Pseudogracilibacillus auburnensis]